MKQIIILASVLLLTACGGSNRFEKSDSRTVSRAAPMAVGPISKACMASDRKARSRRLCGCIQWAANKTLSGTQQRRAVKFYRDPQLAQDTRQSDRAGDERFWKAYSDYSQRARQNCG